MAKRRVSLTHGKQRSLLTDMLPFEVPPTFSNRGYYCFLRKHSIEIEKGQLRWICNTDTLDATIRLLFGIKSSTTIETELVIEWGKQKMRRFVPISKCEMVTMPFNFRVAHNLDGRTLSIVHPRNQVAVASFYATHSALIIYHTSVSEFSIRRPVSVSRYAYFKDKLHEERLDLVAGVEEEDREYEQLTPISSTRNIETFIDFSNRTNTTAARRNTMQWYKSTLANVLTAFTRIRCHGRFLENRKQNSAWTHQKQPLEGGLTPSCKS